MELDRDSEQQLLGRPVESVLTAFDRRALKGRRLLVTGAGGSVGSELARQLASCTPASLTLIDHAEYNLFRVEHRRRGLGPVAAGGRQCDPRRPRAQSAGGDHRVGWSAAGATQLDFQRIATCKRRCAPGPGAHRSCSPMCL